MPNANAYRLLDPNKEAYRVEYNLNSEVPFLATNFSDGRRLSAGDFLFLRATNIVCARLTSNRSRGTATTIMNVIPSEGLRVLKLRKVRLVASASYHIETFSQHSSRTWRPNIVNMLLLPSEHDASAE